MGTILYQGHASLRIETAEGKVIYVDPFAGEGYTKEADLILITHEHYDHNDVGRVPTKESTVIVRSADALSGGVYRNFDLCGAHIKSVPAFNDHHPIQECVGYVLTLEGKKIYIAGDTSTTQAMKEIGEQGIDYCFLPIDGVFNMGPEEATRCAEIIRPKHLIPYHMKPGMLFDIKQDMKVAYPGAMLVRPGDRIQF